MFKALLLSIWYDLSDVKLAEALDDRASFLRFSGFSGTDATLERTAFVRFRKELVAHKLRRGETFLPHGIVAPSREAALDSTSEYRPLI
jgi:IS5 family transposase